MFNKFPSVKVDAYTCSVGWHSIHSTIESALTKITKVKKIVTIEIYPGAFEEDIIDTFVNHFNFDHIFLIRDSYKNEECIREMVMRDLGDDPVFGKLSYLQIDDYFDNGKYKTIFSSHPPLNKRIHVIQRRGIE